MKMKLVLFLLVSAGCQYQQRLQPTPDSTSGGGTSGTGSTSGELLSSAGDGSGSSAGSTSGAVDLGPCAVTPAPCDTNATCTDNSGVAACACNLGFDGDGTSCTLVRLAKRVAVSSSETCAIRDDGALFCWGSPTNLYFDEQSTPTPTRLGTDTFVSVSLRGSDQYYYGSQGVFAVRTDGVLMHVNLAKLADGGDTFGPLGTDSDWVAIAAGFKQYCGLRSQAGHWRLYCGGVGEGGLLGTGSDVAYSFESDLAEVTGGGDWRMLSAGVSDTCAIKADNTLWCWGSNARGELATAPAALAIAYVPTAIGSDAYASVSAGGSHVCAIKTDHTLWCWGDNSQGALGVPSISDFTSTPTQIGSSTDFSAVSAGDGYTCAVHASGETQCWGNNHKARTGICPTGIYDESTLVPQDICGAHSGVDIAANTDHTCLIDSANGLVCFGSNGFGQLGLGTTANHATAVQILADPVDTAAWRNVFAGYQSSCGVKTDGTLWCWGEAFPQVASGPGQVTSFMRPKQVGTDSDWIAGDSGSGGASGGSCVLKGTHHDLYCWGTNNYGQLGDGSKTDRVAPTLVSGGHSWSTFATAFRLTAAVATDHTLWAWGSVKSGQDANLLVPIQFGSATDWQSVFVTDQQTICGIREDGSGHRNVWCWGLFDDNYIDDAQDTPNGLVGSAGGPINDWSAIALGEQSVCGIRADHTMWCYGNNDYGQLGTGSAGAATTTFAPVAGGYSDWATIVAVTDDDYCGLRGSAGARSLWCWGDLYTATPTQVGVETDWDTLSVMSQNCGMRSDGNAWCTGTNVEGEVGDDTAWVRSANGTAITLPTD